MTQSLQFKGKEDFKINLAYEVSKDGTVLIPDSSSNFISFLKSINFIKEDEKTETWFGGTSEFNLTSMVESLYIQKKAFFLNLEVVPGKYFLKRI